MVESMWRRAKAVIWIFLFSFPFFNELGFAPQFLLVGVFFGVGGSLRMNVTFQVS